VRLDAPEHVADSRSERRPQPPRQHASAGDAAQEPVYGHPLLHHASGRGCVAPRRIASSHAAVHTALHDQPLRPKVVEHAPEVGQLLERLHAGNPGYSADLAAWTSVWLAAGQGDELGGRFIDATRDLGELIDRLPEVKEKNLYELSVPFLQ